MNLPAPVVAYQRDFVHRVPPGLRPVPVGIGEPIDAILHGFKQRLGFGHMDKGATVAVSDRDAGHGHRSPAYRLCSSVIGAMNRVSFAHEPPLGVINCAPVDSPIKLDLSRLSYPAFLQVALPFLPGGVFICGALLLNLGGAQELLSLAIPVWAKVVLAIFAAYTSGVFVHYIVTVLSNTCAYWLGRRIGKWSLEKAITVEPWKNTVWRKVARRVLGDLAPTTDDLYMPELHMQVFKAASETVEPQEKQRLLTLCQEFHEPRRVADGEWFWWHSVLQERFPRPDDDAARHTYKYLLAALSSTGVALLILFAFAPTVHWLLWVTAILSILAGWLDELYQIVQVVQAGHRDPHAVELTARLLRFLDQRPTP